MIVLPYVLCLPPTLFSYFTRLNSFPNEINILRYILFLSIQLKNSFDNNVYYHSISKYRDL